jgi:acyl carrier protein
MGRQELAEKMVVFLKKAMADKEAQIEPDIPLGELGLNSSGRLEFFTMCEDEWSLFFDEDEQEQVRTFNQAVDLVAKMIAA